MSIINFSIPNSLNIRLKEAVRKKGFPSKAELFRYALIKYLDEYPNHSVGARSLDDNPRIAALTDEVESIVIQKLKHRRSCKT